MRIYPKVEYRNGIHLSQTIIYFDSANAEGMCFVSSAKSEFPARAGKILCTGKTLMLLRAVNRNISALTAVYNKPFSIGNLEIELFPSGFMPGAAQILVKIEGRTVVYSGNFSLKTRSLAEKVEIKHCDVLVMPTVYGNQKFSFPPEDEVKNTIISVTTEMLNNGVTPVLLTTTCGIAQEIMHLLSSLNFKVRV
ncbi:MAG: hypothetical protein FJ088_09140, partial [Deltaproteobacteria bacterium]|nr:hypothetical protein [Deltaproteobacteria bacterium]